MKERPGDPTEVRIPGGHGRRNRRHLETLLAISVDEGFMKPALTNMRRPIQWFWDEGWGPTVREGDFQ
jgi:hypothetical protein